MYIYSDEDNAPMIDDAWEAARDRAEQKRKGDLNGLLDMLEIEGSCRECPYITETAEGFLQNGLISTEQMDYLHIMCAFCGGRGKGNCKPNEDRLDKDWADLTEFVKNLGLRHRCIYCANVYRVYGQYKDPDDEWNAIEDLCKNCKYFGED